MRLLGRTARPGPLDRPPSHRRVSTHDGFGVGGTNRGFGSFREPGDLGALVLHPCS